MSFTKETASENCPKTQHATVVSTPLARSMLSLTTSSKHLQTDHICTYVCFLNILFIQNCNLSFTMALEKWTHCSHGQNKMEQLSRRATVLQWCCTGWFFVHTITIYQPTKV